MSLRVGAGFQPAPTLKKLLRDADVVAGRSAEFRLVFREQFNLARHGGRGRFPPVVGRLPGAVRCAAGLMILELRTNGGAVVRRSADKDEHGPIVQCEHARFRRRLIDILFGKSIPLARDWHGVPPLTEPERTGKWSQWVRPRFLSRRMVAEEARGTRWVTPLVLGQGFSSFDYMRKNSGVCKNEESGPHIGRHQNEIGRSATMAKRD